MFIRVVPYDPFWEVEYENESQKIKNILKDILVEVYHIGSTAVKGLAAKSIIDIMPVVTNISLVDKHNKEFVAIAKDILPTYYDANKINYVSQGIFRIHLVGLSFNNGNWIYICTTLKIWTLATVVLYPLAGIIIINCLNIALWDILSKIFLIMILGGMVVSIYIIGKKYE